MAEIAAIILWPGAEPDRGAERLSARVDAAVSLDDPTTKGIHMSRLYLDLQRRLEDGPLTPTLMARLLDRFLDTQGGIGSSASIRVSFDHLVRRDALISPHQGWRRYPSRVAARRRGDRLQIRLETRVTYSSACPCSAALARDAIQEAFEDRFAGQSRVDAEAVRHWLGQAEVHPVPHSQRSHADLLVELNPDPLPSSWPLQTLIDRVESALGTAVQGAVKRADEREFARLNGRNLMFCEDAARRIRAVLEDDTDLIDYRARIAHLERLLDHDAVAVVTKGRPDGLDAWS